MKFKKIAAMLLVVVMVLSMVSCASTTKITVKISFIDQDNNIVIDPYDAVLKMDEPTIMDAVKAVKDAYATADGYGQITLSDDESSVKDVDSYKEDLTADAEGNIKYWMFFLNGEEPSGDANEVVLKDGDAIVFQYEIGSVEE